MKKFSFLSLFAGVAISLAAVTSCGGKKDDKDPVTPPKPVEPEVVTVLDRLKEIKSADNLVVGVEGEIETQFEDPTTAAAKQLTTLVERSYEFTPIAWTRSNVVAQNGAVTIEETNIILNGPTESDGIALLLPTESGNIAGGKIPAEAAKSYKDVVGEGFGSLTLPENKPAFVEALSAKEYTFDLTLNQLGNPNNVIDVLNMIYIVNTLQIDQYLDIVSSLTLESTEKGLNATILIENSDPETATLYPVMGVFEAQFLVGKATDYTELRDDIFASEDLPYFEVDEKLQSFIEMVTTNDYSISMNIPAQGEQPALVQTLWFGQNYFALTISLKDDPTVFLERQAFTALDDTGIEIWTDVPVDPEDPAKGLTLTMVDKIPAADIVDVEEGFTLIDFLHLFVQENIGLSYISDLPELGAVSIYTSTYEKKIFNDDQLPGGFIFDDFGDTFRIKFEKDYSGYPVPAGYTIPFNISFSAILWGENTPETLADDEVSLALITLDGMGSLQLPYTGFGVTCPMIPEIVEARSATI